MNDTPQRIERAVNALQTAIGLIGVLRRTLHTLDTDLDTVDRALTRASVALHQINTRRPPEGGGL